MPKELTHWILADRAYAELSSDSSIKSMIANNRDYYLAGAVLPDTLMHLRHGDKTADGKPNLAQRFHDTDTNSFQPLINAESKFTQGLPDNLFACLLGVISHMQADIAFHPFVFNVAGIQAPGRHYKLETALDIYFIRRGAVPPAKHLRDLVTPDNREELITACSLIFDPDTELSRTTVELALNLHCRYQNMYDKRFWRIMARLLGSLPGSPVRETQQLFYPLNLAYDDEMTTQGKWQHPVSGEPRTTSVDELADEAVQQMVAIFEKVWRHGSLSSALLDSPGENLLTGLYGVTKSKMRFGAILRERGKRTNHKMEK